MNVIVLYDEVLLTIYYITTSLKYNTCQSANKYYIKLHILFLTVLTLKKPL